MTAPLIERLGWTLVHSVWQLAALALLLMLLLRLLSHASPRARYNSAALTLAAMAVCLPVTLFVVPSSGGTRQPSLHVAWPPNDSTTHLPIASKAEHGAASEAAALSHKLYSAAYSTQPGPATPYWRIWRVRFIEQVQPWLTSLVSAWLLGITIISIRPLAGWREIRRLRSTQLSPATPDVITLTRRTASRLGISRSVDVAHSTLVQVPAVVGWLSPLILLPLGIMQGLTPAQLESVLAHELAHVRRNDYLVNLLQVVVETLLFYHPAAWWVSRQMRLEREGCCDDLALAICPDRGELARALLALDERRSGLLSAAMAASGGSLLARVRRILRNPAADHSPSGGLVGAATVLALSAALVLVASPYAAMLADEPESPPVAPKEKSIETGTLKGRFLFDGPVPKSPAFKVPALSGGELMQLPDERLVVGRDGGLANVFIYLIGGKHFPNLPVKAKEYPDAVLRILDRHFQPHVLSLNADQTLRVENLDPAGVNINVQGSHNQINRLVAGREDAALQLKAEKFPIPLTSNIHAWMTGWVLPCNHDFHAVSQADGTFSIPRLPPGEWEFRAWHEGSGYLDTQAWPKGRFTVTIKPGENDLGSIRIPPALLTRAVDRAKVSSKTSHQSAAAEPWFWPDPFPHLGRDDRKGDGWSYLRMAADAAAGDEVGIADDQRHKMLELFRDCQQRERDLGKKLHEDGKVDAAAWSKHLHELWSKTKDTAREYLSPAQHRHLEQLVIQRKSYNAFRDAELIKRLELTDDQHAQILAAIDAHLRRIKYNELELERSNQQITQAYSGQERVARVREQTRHKSHDGRLSHRRVWDTIHDVLSRQQREQFNRLRGSMPESVRPQLSLFEPARS